MDDASETSAAPTPRLLVEKLTKHFPGVTAPPSRW